MILTDEVRTACIRRNLDGTIDGKATYQALLAATYEQPKPVVPPQPKSQSPEYLTWVLEAWSKPSPGTPFGTVGAYHAALMRFNERGDQGIRQSALDCGGWAALPADEKADWVDRARARVEAVLAVAS